MPATRFSSLVVGANGNVSVEALEEYTVSVDPASQGAAGMFETAVTATGVEAGDYVVGVYPPSDLEATLIPLNAYVSAADTITVVMQATAIVDGAAKNWVFLVART